MHFVRFTHCVGRVFNEPLAKALYIRPMYIVEYVTESDGVEYRKWIASIHYGNVCDNLINLMKGGREKVNDYGLPFTISLVSALESNLNDWLIMDTFNKHGPENYENIVNGYMSMSIKNKYRTAVAVMTDNHFQIIEDSSIVKSLDELIEVRNKFVHAKPRFYSRVSKHTHKPRKQRAVDHPVHKLKIADCRRFLKAVKDYDRYFFRLYDEGEIKENKLIREVESLMRNV